MKKLNPCLTTWLATALLAPAAQAQDNVVKVGVTRYDTHAKTNGVSGIGIAAGADAMVGDATTVIFVYERLFGPRWGVELVLGVPPQIKVKASGSVSFLGELMTARNVAPTLLVNYHFGQAGDPLRPYIGAGINYTRFTNVRSSYAWDIKLSDSVGPAVHAGVEYALTKPVTLWASVSTVKVKSDLVAVGNTVLQTTIDFRPTIFSAGASYKF